MGVIKGFLAFAILPAGFALAINTTTVTFQQGVNGYTGTFDRKISENSATAGTEFDGSTKTSYGIDGNGTASGGGHSADGQVLIRFDNIIGNNPGQIPANASILSASLTLLTNTTSNDQTGGPTGISGLLQPFDSSTSYYTSFSCGGCSLTSRGPWYQDGTATRPVASVGKVDQGKPGTFDVRPLMQQWVNGTLANNGMVIQKGFPGDLDEWVVRSSGATTAANRPKLSVTYTTDSTGVNVFRRDLPQGATTYTADVSAAVESGADLVGSADDKTTDGSTITGGKFIDGKDDGVTARTIGLFKFNNVFGSGVGQANASAPVEKGFLVFTTASGGTDPFSPGPLNVRRMLRDWNTTTLYSNFGSTPGLSEADGDFSAPIASMAGGIAGGEVWFDVTSYLEDARLNPAQDFGLALENTTNDGWSILFSGSTTAEIRPRLVVYSDLTSVSSTLLGDFNQDHAVDAADYVTWRSGNSPIPNSADDYAAWRSHFGQTNTSGGASLAASAVPEPASAVLLWVCGILLPLARSLPRPV